MRHARFALLVVFLLGGAISCAAEPMLPVGVVRNAVDAEGRVTDTVLQDSTGWKTLHAFTWRLEVESDAQRDKFVPADINLAFKSGQRIRIQIESLTDLYFYVLVHNADGTDEVLVPDQELKEEVPHVKRGASLLLPVLKFEGKAGQEHLRILASPDKLPWVAPKEIWELSRKAENGQALDQKEQATLDQLKSIRTKSIGGVVAEQKKLPPPKTLAATVKGLGDKPATRGAFVVAGDPDPAGNLVVRASPIANDRAFLVVDLFLKHE